MVVFTMPSAKQTERDYKFEANLCYILRPYLKHNKRQRAKEIFLRGKVQHGQGMFSLYVFLSAPLQNTWQIFSTRIIQLMNLEFGKDFWMKVCLYLFSSGQSVRLLMGMVKIQAGQSAGIGALTFSCLACYTVSWWVLKKNNRNQAGAKQPIITQTQNNPCNFCFLI